MEPDLAGFRAARERKRAAFSELVVLLGEVAYTYAPGTPLDDDGDPLDPNVTPTASAQASAAIQAEFYWRAQAAGRGIQAPFRDGALGVIGAQHPTLIAGSGASGALTGKTHFLARGELYKINAVHFDGITGIDRILIYGAEGAE